VGEAARAALLARVAGDPPVGELAEDAAPRGVIGLLELWRELAQRRAGERAVFLQQRRDARDGRLENGMLVALFRLSFPPGRVDA